MNPNLLKKHNMIDPRWTIEDKLHQYKGLIPLLKRDNKINRAERIIQNRKYSRQLSQLKNSIKENIHTLSNVIKGDPIGQNVILSKNIRLQRMCKDFHREKTIEYLEHIIFNKKKLLNRININYNKKLKELSDQKMKVDSIENLHGYSSKINAKYNQKIEEIVEKIEKFQIKRDTAIQVRHTYTNIIKVLKEDSNYYNKVLEEVQADHRAQSKCIYSAIILGQLASENKDDKKQEFSMLYKIVKGDYKHRMRVLELSKNQLNDIQSNLKNSLKLKNKADMSIDNSTEIQEEINKIKEPLAILQDITQSISFNDILPNMVRKVFESKKLIDVCNNYKTNRLALLHKIKNVQVKCSRSDIKTTSKNFEYIQTKKELEKMLQKTNQHINKMNSIWEENAQKINEIRAALLNFNQMCKSIKLSVGFNNEEKNLIENLCLKLSVMMSTVEELNIETDKVPKEVQKCYENLIIETVHQKLLEFDDHILQIADIEELQLPDGNIKTYTIIKNESKKIVEDNKNPTWMK